MSLDEAIEWAEREGFYWAIGRDRSDGYSAACSRKGEYIGDDLSGPGVCSGSTPAEALENAVRSELAYEAKKLAAP